MSSYITSILDLSKIITSVRYNDKPASQVLDPFSCLIRLCLLNYKPIGTKLSFTNNKIVFQEPDFLQSAKKDGVLVIVDNIYIIYIILYLN